MSFYQPSIYRSQKNRHHLRHFSLLHLSVQYFTKSSQHFHLEIYTLHPLLSSSDGTTNPQPSTARCSLIYPVLLNAAVISQQKWEYVYPILYPFPSFSPSPLKAYLGSLDKNQNLSLSLQIFGLFSPSICECHLHFVLL